MQKCAGFSLNSAEVLQAEGSFISAEMCLEWGESGLASAEMCVASLSLRSFIENANYLQFFSAARSAADKVEIARSLRL